MNKVEVKVGIKGLSPLLYSRYLGSDSLEDPQDPRGSAIRHFYYICDPERGSVVYIPGEAIFSSILHATKVEIIDFKRRGSRIHGFHEFLDVKDKTPFLYNGDGSVVTLSSGWKIDSQSVFTGNHRSIHNRPRIDDWHCDFTIVVKEGFSLEKIRDFINAAGLRAGLLGFRPQKQGPYGRFTVVKWEPDLSVDEENENFLRVSDLGGVS